MPLTITLFPKDIRTFKDSFIAAVGALPAGSLLPSCLCAVSRTVSFRFLDFKFQFLQSLDVLEFPNAKVLPQFHFALPSLVPENNPNNTDGHEYHCERQQDRNQTGEVIHVVVLP
ncbi:MAG TPA: hypothetical protein VJW77_02265 [Terriglobia bacterium]|nr:hypothetical protein [Terriglobia bacterium]